MKFSAEENQMEIREEAAAMAEMERSLFSLA